MVAEQHDELPLYPFGDTSHLTVDPLYDSLRERCPVSRVHMPYGGDAWLASSHAAVRTVLSDRRFSRAAAEGDVPRLLPAPPPGGSILTADAPAHGRLRRPVMRAFTARRIENLRPRIGAVVAELIDRMQENGPPVDVRSAFAEPLAITMICEVLGVPPADREVFRALTAATMAIGSGNGQDDAEVGAAMGRFFAYFEELVDARRARPGDDLLSALIATSDTEENLTKTELVWLGVALLIGGHETTINQMDNSLFVLLSDPDRWAALRDRPETVGAAIEELLRFVPLNSGSAYAVVATEDILVDGTLVHAGEAVVPDIAVANRDPTVFEHPEMVDFGRDSIPHLSFGFGSHHCVGAQLARIELKTGLTGLLTRFPNLELTGAESDVTWSEGSLIRGPSRLMVQW